MFRTRLLTVFAAIILSCFAASAQMVCFWTNDESSLPIRIYVDKTFMGEITQAFDYAPEYGTPGTVSVNMTYEKHDLAAANCFGEIYDGWPEEIRPRIDQVNNVCIKAGHYKNVSHSSRIYSYVFYDWYPVPHVHVPGAIHYMPSPYIPRKRSPREDDDLAIAMAVGAFVGATAMTVKVVGNWDYPDYRFPGILAGYSLQYYPGLDAIRNVAKVKARFGNLGGLSLMADAGNITDFYYCSNYFRRSENSFTCSVGAGLEYSGFGMNFQYMPSIEANGPTALTCNLGYDFYINKKFVISLAGGFGVSGWGTLGDNYEWPLTFGLSYRF